MLCGVEPSLTDAGINSLITQPNRLCLSVMALTTGYALPTDYGLDHRLWP